MRMIRQPRRTDNAAWRRRTVGALIASWALLPLALGCQPAPDDEQPAAGDQTAGSVAASGGSIATGCPAVVTSDAFAAFLDLARQLNAAGTFAPERLGQLAGHPVYARWLRSFGSPDITSRTLDSWVARAIIDRGYVLPDQPQVPFVGTYASLKYDFERAVEIDEVIARFVAEETGCRALERASGFVRPERMPDTLRVDFMAGNAEIRNFEGHVMVDGGLALTLGQAQLAQLLASVIFQEVEFIPGAHPADATGTAAIYETWRVLLNGGIAAWIEDQAHLYFGNDHPRLERATPVPEEIFGAGARVIAEFEPILTRVLADRETLASAGTQLHRVLTGSQAYQSAGLLMATLIEERLGVPRLQASCHAVSDFLEAYQEAAKLNPDRPTPPRGRIAYHLTSLRPLSPETYAKLRSLVLAEEATRQGSTAAGD